MLNIKETFKSNKLFRGLSITLTSIIVASTISCIPARASNSFPYKTDSNNYDKPQSHTEQSILADLYSVAPGSTPTPGWGEEPGWKFYQTVLFPQKYAEDDMLMSKYYNHSDSIVTEMAKPGYTVDKNNVIGDSYYDNWRFADLDDNKDDGNTYNYKTLTYYQNVNILGDICKIGYKIDDSTFKRADEGAVMFIPYSQATTNPDQKFVHNYHIAKVTANPIHSAPTADFFFDGGNTAFKPGDSIGLVDGKKDIGYTDGTKYWSCYTNNDNEIVKHASAGSTSQSYGYENAVILNSNWSVTDSSGKDVTSSFNPQYNNGNDSNYVTLSTSGVPEGTYTAHHIVKDNWGASSEDQKKTFTVGKAGPVNPNEQYKLTVKYTDGGTAGDSGELKAGQTKTLWEKPSDGYTFVGWTTTPSGVKISDKNVITMPNSDVTATANFSKYPKMVNLTVKAYPENAGTVTGGGTKPLSVTGKADFNVSQTPSKKAPQNSHWNFIGWRSASGDKSTPDKNGDVSITKDTVLVAQYQLVCDNPGKTSNDTSKLTIDAKIKVGNASDSTASTTATAKEGQLITFIVNTHSNDYKYMYKKIGATEDNADLHTWPNTHTPSDYIYPNGDSSSTYRANDDANNRDSDGFKGKLNGSSEGYWYYWDSDGYIYLYDYNRSYWGNVYRSPIPWFSAQKIQVSFPNEITYTTGEDLNSALKDNLNDCPINPLEWYIQSNPMYSKGTHDYEIMKNNTERIEFYLPLTTPVTINDDGVRLRDPYVIHLKGIETNGYITADTTVKLDVKNNIYQGIYTTPIN